jgi:hypothetical protein
MDDPQGVPVLTCIQVREDTITSVVPGATQDVCDKCGHRVWISRSGQAMMAEQEIKIRCLECVMGNSSKEEFLRNEDVRIVPGAVQEILKTLRGRPDETG